MIDIKKIVEKDTKRIEDERALKHIPSGRLSASMLGQPLQWQILKWLGVAPVENDDYTLGVFRRGRDVEDWLVDILKQDHKVKEQTKCLYRGVIGYLDVLIKNQAIEVKSTNAMAYKHVIREGRAKKGHALQGALYALALDLPEFSVCYVNCASYQIKMFTYRTRDFKSEIDQIIDDYEACKKRKEIPVFVAIEYWNKLRQYMKYPDFQRKDESELYTIAETLYSSKL